MRGILKIGFLVFMLLLVAVCSHAQQKLQVVTKVFQESFSYDKAFLLEISAEKADLKISTSTNGKVNIKVSQIVKNSSLQLAQEDLKAHNYSATREKQRLFLHNFILTDKNPQKISSLFSTLYEISMPNNGHLKIKNQLGDIEIRSVEGSFTIQSEYGNTLLDNCNGIIQLNSKIGNVSLESTQLLGSLKLNNTNLRVSQSGGNHAINSFFGTITYSVTPQLKSVFIESENSEINLINKSNTILNYKLECRKGTLNLSNGKVTKDGELSFYKSALSGATGTVSINALYGNINIY